MGCIQSRTFSSFISGFSSEKNQEEKELEYKKEEKKEEKELEDKKEDKKSSFNDMKQDEIIHQVFPSFSDKKTKSFEEQILETETVFPKSNFITFPEDIKIEEPESRIEFSKVETSKLDPVKEEGEWQEV